MEQEKKQQIALMRYAAIAPLYMPDGTILMKNGITCTKKTVLMPRYPLEDLTAEKPEDKRRSERTDLLSEKNYPRMYTSAIYKQLQDNGAIHSSQVSESTGSCDLHNFPPLFLSVEHHTNPTDKSLLPRIISLYDPNINSSLTFLIK